MFNKLKEKSILFNSALRVWNNHKIWVVVVAALVVELIIK